MIFLSKTWRKKFTMKSFSQKLDVKCFQNVAEKLFLYTKNRRSCYDAMMNDFKYTRISSAIEIKICSFLGSERT